MGRKGWLNLAGAMIFSNELIWAEGWAACAAITTGSTKEEMKYGGLWDGKEL